MQHDEAVWTEFADCTVLVRIPGVDDALERLTCRKVAEDQFSVCCLPFSLYNVCLGDTIRIVGVAPETPGVISEKVEDGGRYLFRVALTEPGTTNMQSAASTFISMGHLVEVYSPMMLAVDAADDQAMQGLAAFLQMREDAGDWDYETGRQ